MEVNDISKCSKISQVLRQEHDFICGYLMLLEKTLEDIVFDDELPVIILSDLLSFFDEYVLKYHFEKEENILFKALEEAGAFKEDLPIEAMLQDHILIKSLIIKLNESLEFYVTEKENKQTTVVNLKMYFNALVEILKSHSRREDRVLYPMGDRLIGCKETDKIIESYMKIKKLHFSMIIKYQKMLDSYQKKILGKEI